MNSTHHTSAHPARELGVDVARGVAVLGMFVAHTAPSAGPANVLMLSEYFPFPLFALLLGGGAEFVGRRMGVRRHVAESAVRALILVSLGWALTQAGAQVAVVLGPLAVAVAVGWLLSILPSVVLMIVAVVGFAVTGAWTDRVQSWRFDMLIAGRTELLDWSSLVLSPYYPVPFVLACAAAGVLVVRALYPQERDKTPSSARTLWAAVLLTGFAGVLFAMGELDLLDTDTTSWGWATTTASLALAVAVCTWCAWFSRVTPKALVMPFYAVGAMAFTAYSLHILWLAYWVRVLFPGERDNAWVNVIGMSVVAILLAMLWQHLPLRGRWWRGPLEGAVGTLTGWVGRWVDRWSAGPRTAVSPVRTEVGEPLDRR